MAAMLMAGAACGKGAGLDSPLDPSSPPAGLDTSQRQMKDGAGNPGPVRVQLQSVRPDLNSLVTHSSSSSCNQSAPWSCFEFAATICMDAVSNPTNSPLLNNMKISAAFSEDGTNPILEGTLPYPAASAGLQVSRGACTSVQTATDRKISFPGAGVPRFFMVIVGYGTSEGFTVNQAVCPTPEVITSTSMTASPNCSFRAVYDLGYHR